MDELRQLFDYQRFARNPRLQRQLDSVAQRYLSLEEHLEYLTEDTPVRDDALEALSEALEKLTPVQRDVVILHYYFGLQHTEIAQKLHLTPANTRKICSLALAALRKNMNP